MSYELFTRGQQTAEKFVLTCPKCGEKNEVLWFPASSQTYRVTGSTGISSTRTDRRKERVQGVCKKCGYKFKPKDMD